MAIKDVRNAFNSAAEGVATANVALMNIERASDSEFQRLEFQGTLVADGSPFKIRSDRIRAGGDLIEAAKATAATLRQQQGGSNGPQPQ